MFNRKIAFTVAAQYFEDCIYLWNTLIYKRRLIIILDYVHLVMLHLNI